MDKIRMNTEKAQREFLKHLQIEGNERIIFSGQFGIGKTTFLREFKEVHKNKYRIFHLFPVNYSVASNEDIFELVKYDLFYEVLEHLVEEDKADLLSGLNMSKREFLPFFLAQNWDSVARSFLKFIPKVGKSIADFVEEYEKLKNLFDSKRDEFNQSHGDLVRVFSQSIQHKSGQLYEFDQFSEILKGLIRDLNSEDSEKENVLIIDDLDRVDPDHLFRLLNVFAAHVDFDKEDSNKFGFDRIIFVMDINNVRRIFESRYGQNVDFSGYIDKFYSLQVFKFDIVDEIISSLQDLILTILIKEYSIVDFSHRHNRVSKPIIFLIKSFIKAERLNLRSLMKIEGHAYSENTEKRINLSSHYELEFASQLNFPLMIDFMNFVFGSSQSFETAITDLTKLGEGFTIETEQRNILSHLSDLIPLLDKDNFPFDGYDTSKKYNYINEDMGLVAEYTLVTDSRRFSANVIGLYELNAESEKSDIKTSLSHSHLFKLILKAYKIYTESI